MKRLREFIYEELDKYDSKKNHVEIDAETIAREKGVELKDINKLISTINSEELEFDDLSQETIKDSGIKNDNEDYLKKLLEAIRKLHKSGYFDRINNVDDKEELESEEENTKEDSSNI